MAKSHAGKFGRGFTLIELLVVIVIIVLLMSILLPAMAAAKKAARVADTTAEMTAIRSACEAYNSLLGAYPGVFKDADIATANAATPVFTGTQNLVLSLEGSLQGTTALASIAANAIGSNAATSIYPPGTGPYDLAASRQYQPFWVPRAGDMVAVGTTPSETYGGLKTIVDHFPDALPILYYRRTAGVDGTLNGAVDTSGKVVGVGESPGTPNTVAAYYRAVNTAYTDSTALMAPSGSAFAQNTASLATKISSTTIAATHILTTYTAGAAIVGGTALPTGGFVLIGAGPNRTYGLPSGVTTNDDIVIIGGE